MRSKEYARAGQHVRLDVEAAALVFGQRFGPGVVVSIGPQDIFEPGAEARELVGAIDNANMSRRLRRPGSVADGQFRNMVLRTGSRTGSTCTGCRASRRL